MRRPDALPQTHVRHDDRPHVLEPAARSHSGRHARMLALPHKLSQVVRVELLNGELFYTLKEAQIIIEGWRSEYNGFRPHSSLEYRPSAPKTVFVSACA